VWVGFYRNGLLEAAWLLQLGTVIRHQSDYERFSQRRSTECPALARPAHGPP
jgi:hypothetical protein